MPDAPVPQMRKADFWTSLAVIAVAVAMLLEALTFPLRGTYAGVRNAWYVSPALLPIIIASSLIVLGLVLLSRAVRAGGARTVLGDVRNFDFARFRRATADFWLVAGLIAVYVYAYVPRIDFIAATALFLLSFTGPYHVDLARPTRLLTISFFGIGALLMAMAVGGLVPEVRTAAAFAMDGCIWLVFLGASAAVYGLTQGDAEARRRFWRCFWISLLTAVLLSVIFKYALLVPLPREGISVAATDLVYYALRAAP